MEGVVLESGGSPKCGGGQCWIAVRNGILGNSGWEEVGGAGVESVVCGARLGLVGR